MKRKWFWFCVAGLLTISSAAAEIRPFAESWNSLAYYDTNNERKGFSSLLGRFEGKLGFNLFDSPLQVYGVYYGTSAQSSDYWDNSIFTGVGVRLKPFEQYKGSGWTDEWIPAVKIFAESLNANYFKGAASAEAAGLRSNDIRYGLDLWHEWNLDDPDESLPWGELWANWSYRETNFGWEDFKATVLYLQPKFGRHLGRGVEAYLRADVVFSGKQSANYYFLNVADYGIGLRFEPWRKGSSNDFLKKFKMFVEVLGVSSLLMDSSTSAGRNINSDVRLGIDFSIGR